MTVRCQHLALATHDLDASRAFYGEVLGLEVATYDPEAGLLALRLADGFVLRFERRAQVHPQGLLFFGLELPTFEEVDRWFVRLEGHVPIVEDLRERYADRPGPYGFLIRDPSGYVVKVFKYGPRR